MFSIKYYIVICFILLLHDTAARDEQFYKKGTNQLQDLTELTAKNPIIFLNSSMFKKYIKIPVRDYSFIVMFNSFTMKCPNCKPMYEEYQLVVNSFRNSFYKKELFFGLVDFDTESNIFQMMRLYFVPALMHFPDKDEPAAAMDVDSLGIKAEAIAKWVNNRADVRIQVQRKRKSEIVLLALNLLFIAIGLVYLRKNLSFLYSKQLWATEAVVFCFLMVSGSMWYQINQTPNYELTKYGPKLFKDDWSAQYGFESYIVALLNAAVANGLILIVESAGGVNRPFVIRTPAEAKVMRLRCLLGLLFVVVFFSLLLYLFRIKVPDYPFMLLF